jgi:hypothetical protein
MMILFLGRICRRRNAFKTDCRRLRRGRMKLRDKEVRGERGERAGTDRDDLKGEV